MHYNLAKRWYIFIQERFSPIHHLVMIGFLFAANAIATHFFVPTVPSVFCTLVTLVVVILIFFRLRVFDEIKDYQTDRQHHPERPLARGLITITEATHMAIGLIVLEGCLSLLLGLETFTAWLVVLIFTYFMYREFFIGSWLRPKMELYAITHTFSSILIAVLISATISHQLFWQLPMSLLGILLTNWGVFNVFEFARKTYGQDEEPADTDSYSKRLTPWGAAGLTYGNILFTFIVLIAILHTTPQWSSVLQIKTLIASVLLLLIFLLVCVIYGIRPTRRQALWFRNSMQLFIILYYLMVGLCLSF